MQEKRDILKIHFNGYRFLKVTYFTLLVFVLETVLFHVANYIHDYFEAVSMISYVILGIGLGAVIAHKIKLSEPQTFILSSLGTIVALSIAAGKVVFFASSGISNLVLLIVFVFPTLYVVKIYREQKSNQIYLFDMLGAFLGVLGVAGLYRFFPSETIFFLILTLLPFVGLLAVFSQKLRFKAVFSLLFLVAITIGVILLYSQLASDAYRLFDSINCKGVRVSPEKTTKIFCGDVTLVRSYDNLAGRVDVTTSKTGKSSANYLVSFDGWPNDQFNRRAISGDYAQYQGKDWPALDLRFLYGVVNEPRVLVMGSSAQGIIKSLKRITPAENITPVEINPAILQIMQEDFFEESGRAYKGLTPVYGNGVSFIRSTDEKFDMITFMNTHPYRNIAHDGAPDYVHTVESYDLYFDHLTEKGYLVFEERPEAPKARLALYRMINTLWHTLKERGAEDPSDHFIIWSWMGGGREHEKYSRNYFVGIVATKNPVDKMLMKPWIEKQISRRSGGSFRFEYFPDEREGLWSNEFVALFDMIESDNFSQLEHEGFDTSLATNDRPFVAQATVTNERLNTLVFTIGIITLILWILFTTPLMATNRKKESMMINGYNILIGFAFFFIEIILFQAYQNVFLSPSASFVAVLGVLLLFSGIGGYFSDTFIQKRAIFLLIPVSLIALYLPDWLFALGVSAIAVKIGGLVFVAMTGFLMGSYFPKGLSLAKRVFPVDKVYYFFAINALAGSFAVVLSLYLGIKIGYLYTLMIALTCYLFASLILKFSRANTMPQER